MKKCTFKNLVLSICLLAPTAQIFAGETVKSSLVKKCVNLVTDNRLTGFIGNFNTNHPRLAKLGLGVTVAAALYYGYQWYFADQDEQDQE